MRLRGPGRTDASIRSAISKSSPICISRPTPTCLHSTRDASVSSRGDRTRWSAGGARAQARGDPEASGAVRRCVGSDRARARGRGRRPAAVPRAVTVLGRQQLLCCLVRYDEALDVAHRASGSRRRGGRPCARRARGRAGPASCICGAATCCSRARVTRGRSRCSAAWATTRTSRGTPQPRHRLQEPVRVGHRPWALQRGDRDPPPAREQFAQLGMRLHNLAVLQIKTGAWSRRARRGSMQARRSCRSETAGARHPRSWRRLAGPPRGPLRRGREGAQRASTRASAEGFHREEALAREFLGDVAFEREQFDRAYDLYRAALAQGER